MVYTAHSKCVAERREGSSPSESTIFFPVEKIDTKSVPGSLGVGNPKELLDCLCPGMGASP